MELLSFTVIFSLIFLSLSSATAKEETGSSKHGLFVNERNNVLVKFFANWCGHCQALAPEYAKLAKEHQENDNIIIAEVDVDAEPLLAQKHHLSYVPLMIFFRQGHPEEFECDHNVDQLTKCVGDRLSKK